MELIRFSGFLSKGPLKGIEIHSNKTTVGKKKIGSKITRVPLDVLSTELSMAFSPSNQYFCTAE